MNAFPMVIIGLNPFDGAHALGGRVVPRAFAGAPAYSFAQNLAIELELKLNRQVNGNNRG